VFGIKKKTYVFAWLIRRVILHDPVDGRNLGSISICDCLRPSTFPSAYIKTSGRDVGTKQDAGGSVAEFEKGVCALLLLHFTTGSMVSDTFSSWKGRRDLLQVENREVDICHQSSKVGNRVTAAEEDNDLGLLLHTPEKAVEKDELLSRIGDDVALFKALGRAARLLLVDRDEQWAWP
jgi:hypothetical protein